MRALLMLFFLTFGVVVEAAPPVPERPEDLVVSERPEDLVASLEQTEPSAPCGRPGDVTCSLIALPLVSLLLPGFGQFWDGRHGEGYVVAALSGLGIAALSLEHVRPEDMPLTDPAVQGFLLGSQLWLDAAFLSAYDTYRYRVTEWLDVPEDLPTVGEALLASMDVRALRNWRVTLPWLTIGVLGISSAFVEVEGQSYLSGAFERFRWHDGAFALGASIGAGVGEEAFFRGYVLHGLDRVAGWNRWLANGVQSLLFAAAHGEFNYSVLVRAGFGYYAGWLAQSADYNLRDAIFLHTWWDVFLFVGMLASERRSEAPVFIEFPVFRF